MLQLRSITFCNPELFARPTQRRTNVSSHCIIQYRKAIHKYGGSLRCSRVAIVVTTFQQVVIFLEKNESVIGEVVKIVLSQRD